MNEELDGMMKSWGEARRRINGVPALQPRSILGRIIEEGAGAAIRGQGPPPPEVMLGDALAVSRAIKFAIAAGKLSDKQYECIFIHFVCYGPVKRKAHQLNVCRSGYYTLLGGGVGALKPYIEEAGGDFGHNS